MWNFAGMTLIDTHTHLYLDEFKPQLTATVNRALAAGVQQMLLPAIDSTEHDNLLALMAKYPANCLGMMGLHPCYVKENVAEELAKVEALLAAHPFVAVGEIGLDFYWDKSFIDQQYEAFRRQLQLSKKYNIPVSIHSRNATDEAIAVVADLQDGGLSGVFHCFGGSVEQGQKIMDLGFYLGIGGVVTYKNAALAEVLKTLGTSRIVLETDAPYLSPVPYRGKRNEPAYLVPVVEKLGDIFGCSAETIADITSANAQNVFKIAPHA